MVLESAIATPAIALNQIIGISLTTALLIAGSLSATDPVSVTALFRELGVDSRLVTLMEGESLSGILNLFNCNSKKMYIILMRTNLILN